MTYYLTKLLLRGDSLELLQTVVLVESMGHVLGSLHPDGVLPQADGETARERTRVVCLYLLCIVCWGKQTKLLFYHHNDDKILFNRVTVNMKLKTAAA